jgi:hypothetical protein
LRLVGGDLEQEDISTLLLGEDTQHLRLHNLVYKNLTEVYKHLPSSLRTFELIMGDETMTPEIFELLLTFLTTNCPLLKHLRLDSISTVPFTESRPLYLLLNFISTHITSLHTLNLSRNQLSSSLIEGLALALNSPVAAENEDEALPAALTTLYLCNLRSPQTLNWYSLLKPLLAVTNHPLEVVVSEGQTVGRLKEGYERWLREAQWAATSVHIRFE